VVRNFKFQDLLWLEPIAKKYGEWEPMLTALENKVASMVDPGHSIIVLHNDAHGVCFSAVTDEQGIKGFIKMVRTVVRLCYEEGMTFHGHYEQGSWQARVAVGQGLLWDGAMYVFTPYVRAETG